MSKISEEKMDHIEKLSMLKLDPKEKEQIKGDLEKIVAMFDKLSEVDTDGVEPLIHMNPNPQMLAPDELGDHIENKKAMENSKNAKNGYFTVPKIISK